MSTKKGLGISQAVQEAKAKIENKVTSIEDLKGMKIVNLDINLLDEYPDNERVFGNLEGQEFEDLCESIRQRGILQPVIVRPLDDRYQLLAGHQRTRGAKTTGELKVPAIIKSVDDIEARLIWLETNIRGRHLSPEKLGAALLEAQKLIDIKRGTGEIEYKGKTTELIAEKFDMSARSVEELLMIAKKVAESVQKLGISKSSMSHLSKLDKSTQEALVTLVGEDVLKELTAPEIQKTVETMKAEMQNLDNTYKTVLEEKEKELEAKEKEFNRLSNTYSQMRQELGETTRKNADILLQIQEEKSKRLEIQEKLQNADVKDKEKLQEELNAKDEEINKLLMSSIKFDEEIKKLKEDMEETNEEKKLIQENLENLEHDYKKLYDENRKKISENEELKKKLQESNKDYEEVKKELQQLKEKDTIDYKLKFALEQLNNTTAILESVSKLKDNNHIELKKQLSVMVDNLKKQITKI